MKDRRQERCLWMNEEEALGLLNLAVYCPTDMTLEQRSAIGKLSEFCRQFLRDEDEADRTLTTMKTTAAPTLLAA